MLRLGEDRELPGTHKVEVCWSPGLVAPLWGLDSLPPPTRQEGPGTGAGGNEMTRSGALCPWGRLFGAMKIFSFLKEKLRLLLPVTVDNFGRVN